MVCSLLVEPLSLSRSLLYQTEGVLAEFFVVVAAPGAFGVTGALGERRLFLPKLERDSPLAGPSDEPVWHPGHEGVGWHLLRHHGASGDEAPSLMVTS